MKCLIPQTAASIPSQPTRIAPSEPIFVLRATDPIAAKITHQYAQEIRNRGGDQRMADRVDAFADNMLTHSPVKTEGLPRGMHQEDDAEGDEAPEAAPATAPAPAAAPAEQPATGAPESVATGAGAATVGGS